MQQSIILDIREFLELVAQLPQWLLYFGVPALLLLSGLILAIVHADRAFPPVALFLGAVGLVLVASIAETLGDFMVWAALYLAVAALTRLLFFIPFPQKKKKDRDEDIYAAFHAPLDEGELLEEAPLVMSAEEGEDKMVAQANIHARRPFGARRRGAHARRLPRQGAHRRRTAHPQRLPLFRSEAFRKIQPVNCGVSFGTARPPR